MSCRGVCFLLCADCHTWFCVPAACDGLEIYHRGCDHRLQFGGADCVGRDRVRAVVSWFSDTGRNEVRPCAEGK
jgi:hypothetical protein